jgi:hypothetical protein
MLEAPLIWLGVPSTESRARSTFERNAEMQSHCKIEEQVWLRGRPSGLRFLELVSVAKARPTTSESTEVERFWQRSAEKLELPRLAARWAAVRGA